MTVLESLAAAARARRKGVIAAMLPAVLLLLTSCTGSQDVADGNSLSALSTPPVVTLTSAGIGGISHGSAYSNAVFQRALPGFELETVKTLSEGEFKWLVAAFKNGSQQIQFERDRSGKKVGSIHIVGLEAAGPNGERIGMSFAETGGRRFDCRPGKEEWKSMAVCQTPDHMLTYVYAPPEYAGPDGRLPPDAELAKARLVRMVWRATEG